MSETKQQTADESDGEPFMVNPRIRYHEPLKYSYSVAIDGRVSLQARGFYAYLQALVVDHVDDADAQIAEDFAAGEPYNTAMAAADELEALGYLKRSYPTEAGQ